MMMRSSGFSIASTAVTILIGFGLVGCGPSFPCGAGQACLPGTFCKLVVGSCDDAAAAGADCRFHCADAFHFIPDEPCDAAFNWYSSFGYAGSDEQNRQMLQCAFDSLTGISG